MKKLIFRYWDDVLKYFVRSDEFLMENELESLAAFFQKASKYAHNGIVQRYSEMKDRNGNPVFEGDILQENTTMEKSRLFFAAGTFMLDCDILYNHFYGESPEILEDFKVVGNIFETPNYQNE
jgi:predicted glutamine amidotransferase